MKTSECIKFGPGVWDNKVKGMSPSKVGGGTFNEKSWIGFGGFTGA